MGGLLEFGAGLVATHPSQTDGSTPAGSSGDSSGSGYQVPESLQAPDDEVSPSDYREGAPSVEQTDMADMVTSLPTQVWIALLLAAGALYLWRDR